jgi:hypothetical protein
MFPNIVPLRDYYKRATFSIKLFQPKSDGKKRQRNNLQVRINVKLHSTAILFSCLKGSAFSSFIIKTNKHIKEFKQSGELQFWLKISGYEILLCWNSIVQCQQERSEFLIYKVRVVFWFCQRCSWCVIDDIVNWEKVHKFVDQVQNQEQLLNRIHTSHSWCILSVDWHAAGRYPNKNEEKYSINR